MTWGEMKAKITDLGVVDSDEIDFVEIDGNRDPSLFRIENAIHRPYAISNFTYAKQSDT